MYCVTDAEGIRWKTYPAILNHVQRFFMPGKKNYAVRGKRVRKLGVQDVFFWVLDRSGSLQGTRVTAVEED